jgi:hypothetical protein
MTEMDTATALAVLVRRAVTLVALGTLAGVGMVVAAEFFGWVGWSRLFAGLLAASYLPAFRFVFRVGRHLGALP